MGVLVDIKQNLGIKLGGTVRRQVAQVFTKWKSVQPFRAGRFWRFVWRSNTHRFSLGEGGLTPKHRIEKRQIGGRYDGIARQLQEHQHQRVGSRIGWPG